MQLTKRIENVCVDYLDYGLKDAQICKTNFQLLPYINLNRKVELHISIIFPPFFLVKPRAGGRAAKKRKIIDLLNKPEISGIL